MLYLVGVALTTYNQIPGVDQRLSDLTAFYGDSGNRLLLLIGGILLAFSAAFLLAFAAGFASSEPERDSQESFLARSAAGLFAACIAISSVALALVAAEVSLRSALQPPPELERWLAEFGYAVLLVPGMVAAAVMVWSLSRSALRAGLIPSIVAVAGYVVAVLCLSALPIAIASELFWSQLPLALWVVVAAAVSSNRSLSRAGSAAGGAWTSSASGRRALRSFGGRRQGG